MTILRTAALALVLGSLACTAPPPLDQYDEVGSMDSVEEQPLGGEALAQRKQELERALGDLRNIHATLASLVDRRDGRGSGVMEDFSARYVGAHLAPLLRAEWQSDHPELMALDANLRFVQAEVMILMRYPRKVQETIDEIERRFTGRENMLIDYPIGEQGTLGKGLEHLRSRKWRG